ncbi:MAG: helix-turn-helix domain-containing protein [Saprospiraceae bacterium]
MHFVSNNIKFLRKKHKLSQCELADKIGLKRGNIASYEKSIAEPKILNLTKLANYFQVSISDFVTSDLSNGIPEANLPISEPIMVGDEFSKIKAQCAEFDSMIKGMHCYHSFTMKKIESPTEDIKVLSNEVERLLSVAKSLMESHKYLIQVIDNHDNCD